MHDVCKWAMYNSVINVPIRNNSTSAAYHGALLKQGVIDGGCSVYAYSLQTGPSWCFVSYEPLILNNRAIS